MCGYGRFGDVRAVVPAKNGNVFSCASEFASKYSVAGDCKGLESEQKASAALLRMRSAVMRSAD